MYPVNQDHRQVIEQLLKQSQLHAVLRVDAMEAWSAIWIKLSDQLTHYAGEMIDYQHAYLHGAQQSISDLSLVLMHDGRPCGIWPLTLQENGNQRISSCGTAILSPMFVEELPARTVKKQITGSIQFIQLLAAHFAMTSISVSERLLPTSFAQGLSEWHQQWMAQGAVAKVRHDLYVDLGLGFDAIKANMRKSYRSLITSAQKIWASTTMDYLNADEQTWQAFKLLHREVAGRVTRSDETWAQQYAMIVRNQALLICLYSEQDGRMVGAGFFQFTKDHAQYSVAAYDRSLFDRPVGHLVQMRAIEQLQARGIRWYELGERFFPADDSAPSNKEMAISSFKQGFATHLSPRFVLEGKLQNALDGQSDGAVLE